MRKGIDKMPGPGAYLVGDVERREVEEVLSSGYLSRYGKADDVRFKKKVVTLEKRFASIMGTKYALAVSGGTGALMAALVGMGVGPGVEVLVPGYTFVASITAVIAVGGIPVLTEIDESLTMDPADIENRITNRTKVIMPVHMLGNSSDLGRIMEIARKNKLLVLEDCCQSLGASYKGKKTGSIGDVGAFSLNINKTITSGDGGVVITDNREFYERAFGFHDQGHKPLRMGVEIGKRSLIGINLRMNELTAAFALGQLSKLDEILATLHEKKKLFKEIIRNSGIKNIKFRKINDPGECATLLTVLFKDNKTAEKAAAALKSKTVSKSGWHVYNNMEQLLNYVNADGKKLYRKHMLPRTDNILDRAVNLSIGVVDPGLGADFGVNVLSTKEEVEDKAEEFVKIIKPIAD